MCQRHARDVFRRHQVIYLEVTKIECNISLTSDVFSSGKIKTISSLFIAIQVNLLGIYKLSKFSSRLHNYYT